MMNILYLHGFRSSPQSTKARQMAGHFAQTDHRFICPQLPASPASAMELACELIEDRGDAAKDWALIGSSLGGFYATFLAERYVCRAALLNPAVHPELDLGAHIGEGFAYDGETPFEFKAEYLDQLVALKVTAITQPQRYFLLAATRDEVLDWRHMRDRYLGAEQHIIEGSNHAISEFADYVDEIALFCTSNS